MARKILIVDDDPNIRKTLARILTDWGYEASGAADGLAALEAIRSAPPALVLLDMQMPGMGGLEFLKAVRAVQPDLAVIMITGVEDEEQAKKSMELGASDYIVKPFDFDYLRDSVRAKLATVLE